MRNKQKYHLFRKVTVAMMGNIDWIRKEFKGKLYTVYALFQNIF